jgi:asparagine synthetase A
MKEKEWNYVNVTYVHDRFSCKWHRALCNDRKQSALAMATGIQQAKRLNVILTVTLNSGKVGTDLIPGLAGRVYQP